MSSHFILELKELGAYTNTFKRANKESLF